jgi:hypothetical protein
MTEFRGPRLTITPFHKVFALALFRSSAFFVCAVVAFSQQEERTRTILLMRVFLVDVASYHVLMTLLMSNESVYSRVWGDTLTNRFFYEKLVAKVRDREQIDVPLLFGEADTDAAAVIKNNLKTSTLWSEWGWFRKTLAGIWRFLRLWIGYGLFYSAAALIGDFLKPF